MTDREQRLLTASGSHAQVKQQSHNRANFMIVYMHYAVVLLLWSENVFGLKASNGQITKILVFCRKISQSYLYFWKLKSKIYL